MKKKRSTHKTPSTKDSLGVISYQLSEIHKDLAKNSKDIEDLKHQVSMGKGGIKAVFVVGSIVAIILTAIKILKG
jgi:predicted  nucleic acid-binding Zn-ribbon protein|tara:strand:- start:32 stop:256 length:225 start_codon:yes stop_codon:yes gene_type:complete